MTVLPKILVKKEKKTEQKLARENHLQKMSALASLIAHEIHNSLGGIRGFATLLQRDLQEHPELQKLATSIVEGLDTLDQLINQILHSSRYLQLSLEVHDLVPLVKELILLLNADENIDPRIGLHLKGDSHPIWALVDVGSLKAALLNLANNAIQAMPSGGELCFTLLETANNAIIRVSDTGAGISEENQKKLFAPFFTTRPEGHGLGLSEVYKIIQGHHGEIEIASKVGEGTIFTIYLLRAQP